MDITVDVIQGLQDLIVRSMLMNVIVIPVGMERSA